MTCQHCGRSAKYIRRNANKYKGTKKRHKVRARHDHDLCFECWHKIMQAQRAKVCE